MVNITKVYVAQNNIMYDNFVSLSYFDNSMRIKVKQCDRYNFDKIWHGRNHTILFYCINACTTNIIRFTKEY